MYLYNYVYSLHIYIYNNLWFVHIDTTTAVGVRWVGQDKTRISLFVRCIFIDDKQQYTITSCQISLYVRCWRNGNIKENTLLCFTRSYDQETLSVRRFTQESETAAGRYSSGPLVFPSQPVSLRRRSRWCRVGHCPWWWLIRRRPFAAVLVLCTGDRTTLSSLILVVLNFLRISNYKIVKF
jgi:hypothetical protein